MALIKCPECGREVSDRAGVCPNCAFPLNSLRTDGVVSIKTPNNLLGTVYIVEVDTRKVLWSGKPGQMAKFEIAKPIEIGIAWGVRSADSKFFPGATAQVQAGRKHEMALNAGFWGTKVCISEVDVFDSGR